MLSGPCRWELCRKCKNKKHLLPQKIQREWKTVSHPFLGLKKLRRCLGATVLGSCQESGCSPRVPAYPHHTCPSTTVGLTPGTSFELPPQNFKGITALQGVTGGKGERIVKATQASWMPSCVPWQAAPICEGFWEGQCWTSHPEKKTSKAGVF